MQYKGFKNKTELISVFEQIIAENFFTYTEEGQRQYLFYDGDDNIKNIYYQRNFIDTLPDGNDIRMMITPINERISGYTAKHVKTTPTGELEIIQREKNGVLVNCLTNIYLTRYVADFKFTLYQPISTANENLKPEYDIINYENLLKHFLHKSNVLLQLSEYGMSSGIINSGKYILEDKITYETDTGVKQFSTTHPFIYYMIREEVVEKIELKKMRFASKVYF